MDEKALHELGQLWVRHLCGHAICLTGTAFAIKNGKREGKPIFFNFSGFVISYEKCWIFVTAGHVFERLDKQLREEEVELENCFLADYFGLEVGNYPGIPFAYKDEYKTYIDDDELGLDFGVMFLRPYYVQLLKAMKVRPIVIDGKQNAEDYKDFTLLGFPCERFDHDRKITASGHTVLGAVQPVLLNGRASDALPQARPIPKLPWFAMELYDRGKLKDIDGMSGGPIFGVRPRGTRPPQYTVVAVQSFWDSTRRIAFGTRTTVIIELLRMDRQRALAEMGRDMTKAHTNS